MSAPRVAVRARLKLCWGKVRRFYLSVFRRRYVRESLTRRQGVCARCGACCQLGYRCTILITNGSLTECRLHKLRPPNCRLFPIDERDLADRDLVAPHVPCGFRFDPKFARSDRQ